jgi:cytochrome c biogenesis protein CcmG/thiol:disulfide interchange protein DsbE
MNWRRAAIAALVAVPVILLFRYGLHQDPREIPSPLPGNPAPHFSLAVFAPGEEPLLSRPIGDTLRLADLRGRVVVLNFWASWCLACRDEHAGLSQVAREYTGKPVTFIGSLYQDTPSAGTSWIAQMGGAAYPSVDDPRARTAIDYGLYGVPETFFISADGRIAHKITGPAEPALVRQILDSLLSAGASP